MNKEREKNMTEIDPDVVLGAFYLVGVLAVSLGVGLLAGPGWGLVAFGALILAIVLWATV